jgi:hypothetical protein
MLNLRVPDTLDMVRLPGNDKLFRQIGFEHKPALPGGCP